jgi:cytochrome c oxidase subunit 2
MRAGPLLRLLVIALLAAVFATAVAVFIPWLPAADSEEATRIHWVFWFTTVICIAIFAVVASVLVYSIWKFRVKPDDDSDGSPIHGHTGLEIGWTAIPTVLVTAIAIVSAVALARNDDAKGAMRVNVTGQQFAWSFAYPESGDLTSTTLRLPVGQKVKLYMQSKDVLHSFWVPEFSQKQDLVPGETTTLVITPKKVGKYALVCTELCGLGHALMRARVEVVSTEDFAKWTDAGTKAAAAGGADQGESIFAANGCGSCHTFEPAGATGKIGPDLDDIKGEAAKAGQPPAEFVRTSIVEPDAHVAAGYPPGVMPKTYSTLPKDQVDALVQYLTKGAE